MTGYEEAHPLDRKRPSILNFHDSIGFISYGLKAKLEAAGETVVSITVNGSTTKIGVDFQDVEDGFANPDSAWETKLIDAKAAGAGIGP